MVNMTGFTQNQTVTQEASGAPRRGIFNAAVERPMSRAMSRDLDTVFHALADPTRRAILAMLLEDDMSVTDVAEPFPVSLAAISKHLGILTRAGLIAQERRGRVVWCKLDPEAMRAASVWMRGFGQFDPVNLDAYERFLVSERLADPPGDP